MERQNLISLNTRMQITLSSAFCSENKVGRWVICRTIVNCLVTSLLGILCVTENVGNVSYVTL
jgi:hypothetical protein